MSRTCLWVASTMLVCGLLGNSVGNYADFFNPIPSVPNKARAHLATSFFMRSDGVSAEGGELGRTA